MSLVERAPSEQESFSPLSRTESSMSDSSSERDAGEAVGKSANKRYCDRLTSEDTLTSYWERKLQADEEVAKQEESLAACRENLKSLHRQCAELQHRVSELERFNRRVGDGEGGKRGGEGEGGEGKGVASCGFLKAQLRRVKGEIEREENAEEDLMENLKAAQLELSAATMAYSDYRETEEELRVRERQAQTAKNLQALQRLQTQTRMRVNTHRVKKSQERLEESSRRLEETRTREAIERARQTMRDGQAFLQKTLEQRRTREQEERERERGESERRLTAVLSLKRNIENSEGTIQALQLLQEERNKKTRLREERLRTQAATQGDNPDEVVESSSDEYDGDEREGERREGEASGETLAQPEINGLWSLHSETAAQQSHKIEEEGEEGEEVKDGGTKGRKKERSKLEQKTLTGVIDNLRQSIVKRQVVAGREFKGPPFTSKPEVVEFRDFSPGERLKLRLVLTNVTYTVNHCKLVGISPHLKDFISVDFNPPGAMSAGLTCHMTVTFEPKLNKDLTGEIEMLTQTGPFSIPVRCTTRKCHRRSHRRRAVREMEEEEEIV
ncbi:Cilia- and flagella-associated protein 74 [Geodia barretti]|uniref:Cilia- and flagella-associated protein 74 n=1 Tax=Geodia barretti TaxID=519541 RepID=A0AA35QVQ6_GEOBA|nr:Cilia- and flagella-associated protein 74 [Geodia barretti]